MWGLTSLWTNFALLPGVRGVTERGPYRLVRHPMYLGECVMVGACGLASGAWWMAGWLALGAVFVAMRVLAEERVLRRASSTWRAYAERVRWRLVPGLW